ncbi:hypothetical protein FACS1894122_11800 [Alphaproteobacteria bacterium]|nr:hypothetical protein FACS1894122_11800 [Alphaproteobacteria bacterium]
MKKVIAALGLIGATALPSYAMDESLVLAGNSSSSDTTTVIGPKYNVENGLIASPNGVNRDILLRLMKQVGNAEKIKQLLGMSVANFALKDHVYFINFCKKPALLNAFRRGLGQSVLKTQSSFDYDTSINVDNEVNKLTLRDFLNDPFEKRSKVLDIVNKHVPFGHSGRLDVFFGFNNSAGANLALLENLLPVIPKRLFERILDSIIPIITKNPNIGPEGLRRTKILPKMLKAIATEYVYFSDYTMNFLCMNVKLLDDIFSSMSIRRLEGLWDFVVASKEKIDATRLHRIAKTVTEGGGHLSDCTMNFLCKNDDLYKTVFPTMHERCLERLLKFLIANEQKFGAKKLNETAKALAKKGDSFSEDIMKFLCENGNLFDDVLPAMNGSCLGKLLDFIITKKVGIEKLNEVIIATSKQGGYFPKCAMRLLLCTADLFKDMFPKMHENCFGQLLAFIINNSVGIEKLNEIATVLLQRKGNLPGCAVSFFCLKIRRANTNTWNSPAIEEERLLKLALENEEKNHHGLGETYLDSYSHSYSSSIEEHKEISSILKKFGAKTGEEMKYKRLKQAKLNGQLQYWEDRTLKELEEKFGNK